MHYQFLSSLSQANIAIVLTNSFEPVSDHDFKKNALPSFHTLLTLLTIYTVDNSQGYFFLVTRRNMLLELRNTCDIKVVLSI